MTENWVSGVFKDASGSADIYSCFTLSAEFLANMNIVLIGYRGAGKSAVGEKLAARLGKEFVDADDLLEKREGRRIREIVESQGWQYFRALEKEILSEVAARDNLVIAPGGGAVLDMANVKALQKNGLIIWL